MARRLFLLMVVLLTGSCFCEENYAQSYQPERFTDLQYREYEAQLNAVLRTHRDEEKAFVAELVQKIREDQLPSKLISTSYQWVRNRRPGTGYPFVYFERVLRLQASKLEIEQRIPEFDYSVYRTRAVRR